MYWVIDVYWCLSSFYPSTFWEWLSIHWLILHATTILRFSCSPAESKLHLEGYRCSRDQQTLSYHSWSSGEWLGSEEQISASVHVFSSKQSLVCFSCYFCIKEVWGSILLMSRTKGSRRLPLKAQLFLGIFDEPFLFLWVRVLLKTSEVQDTSLNSWMLLHYAGVATKISITDNHHGRSFTWRGQMLNSFRPTCFFSVTSPFIAWCQCSFECLKRKPFQPNKTLWHKSGTHHWRGADLEIPG